MTSEQNFVKKLETYLDLEFNDFDKGRVLEYLKEYVSELPEAKPQVVTKVKTVYKYTTEIIDIGSDEILKASPAEIVTLVSQSTGVTPTKMAGRKRDADIVLARHVSMYFINKVCHETLVATGKIFNRDHTSVINAVRNVRNMIEGENPKYIKLIETVSDKLKKSA